MRMAKPELYYWDIRGLAEPIRLLLHYLQVDFQDHRIPFGEIGSASVLEPWASQKHSHGLPFPNIPFYEDEDVKISESLAIMKHLGRKYHVSGDTLKEQATADMVALTLNDVKWQAWLIFNSPNFHSIRDAWAATVPERLAELNRFLDGKDFVLGTKISYVDFLLYEISQWFRLGAPDQFEKNAGLANLRDFQKRIEELPSIKAYMESEKFKSWPFFRPFTYLGYSKDPNFKPPPASFLNSMASYPLEK